MSMTIVPPKVCSRDNGFVTQCFGIYYDNKLLSDKNKLMIILHKITCIIITHIVQGKPLEGSKGP